MSSGALKGLGIGCFVLGAILLFVAWERYDSNAKAVEAANQMMKSSPFGGEAPFGGMMKQMTGSSELKPGVPAATTYSLIFAALAAVGGVVCFIAAANHEPVAPTPSAGPPVPVIGPPA